MRKLMMIFSAIALLGTVASCNENWTCTCPGSTGYPIDGKSKKEAKAECQGTTVLGISSTGCTLTAQ